jgi:hypothetical protein
MLTSFGLWVTAAEKEVPPALEQTRNVGTVLGIVSDSDDGHPIQYANVILLGTPLGAMTLDDGSFRISDVPPGTYRLRVMMMRYQSNESEPITVRADTTTCWDFRIEKFRPELTGAELELVGSEVQVEPSDVLCQIRPGKKVFKVGDRLEFQVRLQNLSDKTFYLVGCLEGSQSRSRYPYTYWVISGPDRCSESAVATWLSALDDTLDPSDFVELRPGDSFDPFGCSEGLRQGSAREFGMPFISTEYSFTQPGHHSVYFSYATLARGNHEWLGCSFLLTFPEEVATLLKQVPRLELSCSMEFEVEE